MSGILRNVLTVIRALLHYRSAGPLAATVAWFRITPLDTGLLTLKSDKYLQLAESAQVDYLIKTALVSTMLANKWQFVNAAQLVRFMRPIRLFSRVRVDSRVMYADGKCAYFLHAFHVGDIRHAEVLVKMKFKNGPVTVSPDQVLGLFDGPKPPMLQHWDEALATA